MLRRVLRVIGIALGALVSLIVVAAGVVFVLSSTRINKIYAINVTAPSIPSDAGSVERGRHLAVAITKCASCHGDNLAGAVMIDVVPFRVVASNLTRGQGGIGGTYSDADWAQAIRHGVRPDGRALLFMPSDEFYHLSDDDLAAIIAYVKSVPPVDQVLPPSEVRPLGRTLLAAGQLPLLSAERIDHEAARPAAPQPGPTVEYGRYLAVTGGCVGCHGAGLSGGPIPGAPPDIPIPTNITPAGIGAWSDDDFFRALREGKRPDGSGINPFMPWQYTREMTDDEIRALLLYLRSVPPRSFGNR